MKNTKKGFWSNLIHACALCGAAMSDDVSYMRYIER